MAVRGQRPADLSRRQTLTVDENVDESTGERVEVIRNYETATITTRVDGVRIERRRLRNDEYPDPAELYPSPEWRREIEERVGRLERWVKRLAEASDPGASAIDDQLTAAADAVVVAERIIAEPQT